jgi:hypothetical protein
MNLSIKNNFYSRILSRNVTQFFVPKHEPAKEKDIEKIQDFLHDKPRILVVTGIKEVFQKLY